MERNEWNNRRSYGHRVDEDSYRGAYRLDTSSNHRNETTWDGFDRHGDSNRRGTDYNRDYNRNYNNDYNRNYNSDQRRNRGESSGEDTYSRDSRSPYPSGNNRNPDEQFRPTSGGYHTRFGGSEKQIPERGAYGAGNFNADYRPDNYGSGGANYGNMAGSLSYGYDGDYNADPDWNRRYDPLTGHRQSYHGHYESRHPERGQRNTRRGRHENDWF